MTSSLSVGRQRLVLSFLVISAVLIWVDTSILGIALRRLADPVHGLGASPGELQWAVGGYSLVFATALFAGGALGDRYGHRSVLLAGIATFGAASVWAAWSSGPVELILARGVMGLGGALMVPPSMAILTWAFPPERRAGAIATWSAASGFGVACGPLLGGALIDRFWWGSVFLVNVPVVLVSLVGISRYAPNPRNPNPRRLEPVALLLSTAGLAALAYGLIDAGQSADWTRPTVWLPVAAGLVGLCAFGWAELRSPAPGFDPRLFTSRRFAAGSLALGATFFAITGQLFYGNFYLQGARGMTAWHTGLTFLPGALGVIAGAAVSPRLVRRVGVAPVSGTALLVMAAGFVANNAFQVDTPLFWFCALGLVQGLAIGAVAAPTTAAVLAVLPHHQVGAGSAASNTVRQVASVLGVAVLGTVLAASYRRAIEPALAVLPENLRDAAAPSAEDTRAVALASGHGDLVGAANHAFIHAMHVTATCAAVAALAGAVAILLAFGRRGTPTTADTPSTEVPEAVAVGEV